MFRIAHVSDHSVRGLRIFCDNSFGQYTGSSLGNKHIPVKGVPGSNLQPYKLWLWNRIKPGAAPNAQLAELDRLIELERKHAAMGRDIVLTCFGKDLSISHCHIIIEMCQYLSKPQPANLVEQFAQQVKETA